MYNFGHGVAIRFNNAGLLKITIGNLISSLSVQVTLPGYSIQFDTRDTKTAFVAFYNCVKTLNY